MYALLICDDPDESAILALILQRIGFSVTTVVDLERALRGWGQRSPSLAVFALRAGALADHVRRVRNEFGIPIVVVCHASDEDLLCRMYEQGADLVLARPYGVRLLTAQLRALIRRGRGMVSPELPALSAGRLVLDPITHGVQIEGHAPRHLTHLEFRLLYTLVIHQGQTLPTETIVERVWGYSGEGSMEVVRMLISRLRSKVEEDPRNPQYILTVPGVGYRLEATPEPPKSVERQSA